jgi:hypothetical protein
VASTADGALTAYNLPAFQPPPKDAFSHSEGAGTAPHLLEKRFVTKSLRSCSKRWFLSHAVIDKALDCSPRVLKMTSSGSALDAKATAA